MNLVIPGVPQQVAALPSGRAQQPAAAARKEAAPQAAPQAGAPAQDKVSLGAAPTAPNVYADPRGKKVGQSELAAMIEESDRKAQAIIDLIRPLVEQQGLTFAKVASGEQQLSADPATIEASKAAIAEGGEFSVENTAGRILSFAKALIGTDPSRFDAIRNAVEQGFQEAQALLGGSLPEISQKTHAAVRAEFDRWKNEGMDAA